MQRLEVSCAVRHIYTSLGVKGLSALWKFRLGKNYKRYGRFGGACCLLKNIYNFTAALFTCDCAMNMG